MSLVKTEQPADGVTLLRLENGKPNAVSTALAKELMAALEAAERGSGAVIIAGRVGMFSAGFDLGTMKEGPAAANEMVKAGGRLALAIHSHPRPIVAACAGHAIAMGLFLTMVCDYRVGARGAYKLQANETAIDMTLPDFGIEFARAAISKRHYDRVIVQSEVYSPEEAVDAGMLDEVVDPEEVEARALEIANRLAALPERAYRNNKRLAHGPTCERIASNLEENIDSLMPAS